MPVWASERQARRTLAAVMWPVRLIRRALTASPIRRGQAVELDRHHGDVRHVGGKGVQVIGIAGKKANA